MTDRMYTVNGLCANCGVPLKSGHTSLYCSKKQCRQIYERIVYNKNKAQGICTQCRNAKASKGHTRCSDCRAKTVRQERQRRRDNPVNQMLKRAKQRAKRKGWEFNLSADDVVIPKTCPVLGIPLKVGGRPNKKPSDNAPTLDRIDNTQGYIKGNVAVISWKANNIKRNYTSQELSKVGQWLQSLGF